MLQQIKMVLAPVTWRFLDSSLTLDPFPEELLATGPSIFSCLHRDILPTIMFVKPARPVLLVSNSPDGDILIRTLGTRHYGFARGATGEGGGPAFRELVRQIDAGRNVGIAVDGPKGPFGKIQDGVLQLARLTGAPIVPLVAAPRRARVLETWDRTVVPYPWTQVNFRHGKPLTLAREAGKIVVEEARGKLSQFFEVGEDGS